MKHLLQQLHLTTKVACACLVATLLICTCTGAQTPPAKLRALVGAYYFDGWSGLTSHVTPALKTTYSAREPIWGWYDNTVGIMQQQIDLAADHGIAFWAFDWYYPETPNKQTPLNNALSLFLQATNRQRLSFCLLVSNHGGYRIRATDWNECCRRWIKLFQEPNYVRLDDKPLLIILSPTELENAFGSVEKVHQALDTLRTNAHNIAPKGIQIAACTGPDPHQMKQLAASGYNLLTGYAYNMSWSFPPGNKPFRDLVAGNQRVFGMFAKSSPLPFVPVITTGWDRRPADEGTSRSSVWYADRTPQQVEDFTKLGVRWLDENPAKTLRQRVLLLYAWNEYGEGGYLTPTKADGTAYLKAVQHAISGK